MLSYRNGQRLLKAPPSWYIRHERGCYPVLLMIVIAGSSTQQTFRRRIRHRSLPHCRMTFIRIVFNINVQTPLIMTRPLFVTILFPADELYRQNENLIRVAVQQCCEYFSRKSILSQEMNFYYNCSEREAILSILRKFYFALGSRAVTRI